MSKFAPSIRLGEATSSLYDGTSYSRLQSACSHGRDCDARLPRLCGPAIAKFPLESLLSRCSHECGDFRLDVRSGYAQKPDILGARFVGREVPGPDIGFVHARTGSLLGCRAKFIRRALSRYEPNPHQSRRFASADPQSGHWRPSLVRLSAFRS
jgi:hypothetical protein